VDRDQLFRLGVSLKHLFGHGLGTRSGAAPIDMKARRVEMAIGGRQAETLGRARCDQAVEVGDAIGVQRIEGAPQGIIVELLGGHARRNEAVGRLILEEHGDQIEGLMDKAQAVEDHGFDGFSYRQVSRLRVLLGGLIQDVANAQFGEHPGDQTSVIQNLALILGLIGHRNLL